MRRAVLAVAIAAALWPVVSAQNPQQVFRAGTVFVNVDAYPRRDGKIVEGLTRADFEVREDGKLQTVEAMEFVRVAPFDPFLELRDPNTVEESYRLARDPRNRVFVIYLDIFHITISGSYFAREPLLNFLRRSLGKNDLFAVMTPEVPVSRLTFARLGAGLASDLVAFWPWGLNTPTISPRSEVENQLMGCGGEGKWSSSSPLARWKAADSLPEHRSPCRLLRKMPAVRRFQLKAASPRARAAWWSPFR